MYRIYVGQNPIHHPNSDKIAMAAALTEEVNTHGSLDITLDRHDAFAANAVPLNEIKVFDDDGLIWRGRVLHEENGLGETKKIHCEGALAYLCDTIIEPFAFRGRPNDYTNSNNQTVKGLFHRFIDIHNAQLGVNDHRRFAVGKISVTDPNNYIFRSSESALTTWEAIQSRLIDTHGGYLYLSGPNLNVINYVDDFDAESNQAIHFGENLLELLQTNDAAGIVTKLYAYGAQYKEADGTPPFEPEPDPATNEYKTWNGNRVHLSGPVSYQTAVDRWGIIYGTNVWNDVTTTEYLQTAAQAWLVNNYLEHAESLEVKAADLSLIDSTVDKLAVGDYVNVICEPLAINLQMLCVRKETNLIDVSQTRISIGKSPVRISDLAGGKK